MSQELGVRCRHGLTRCPNFRITPKSHPDAISPGLLFVSLFNLLLVRLLLYIRREFPVSGSIKRGLSSALYARAGSTACSDGEVALMSK